MIYITGDIHGDPERLSMRNFPEQKEMTKDDYVVILGDFGLVWNCKGTSKNEKYWLDWLEEKPFTTLFVDGNHECFDRLNNYNEFPCEEWNGGKVQKIRPSIIHLMRGEIYNIDGIECLSMGGAASHDIRDGVLEYDDERLYDWYHDPTKLFRVNHFSWWKEEIPNSEERENALKNLSLNNNKIDVVFSHEAPSSDVILLGNGFYEPDEYSKWLEKLRQNIEYKNWFFGHYHKNKRINDKEICLYEDIVRIN